MTRNSCTIKLLECFFLFIYWQCKYSRFKIWSTGELCCENYNYFHLFEEHSKGDRIKIVQTAQSTQVVRKRWFYCRYFTRFQGECHCYNLYITKQSNGSWYNKFGFVNNCATANCWCSCARYWKVGCNTSVCVVSHYPVN